MDSCELQARDGGGRIRKAVGLVAVIVGIAFGAAILPGTSLAESPPATAKPATEIEKWFAQVDGTEEEAFQKQVAKPFDSSLLDIRARYVASLDAAMARASAAGQVEESQAYRTEQQAFEKTWQVADDDGATPAAIKTLRAPFRQQLAKLEQDRNSKARALFAQYDAILEKYQNLLAQHSRPDDALLLKTKREEIARAWLGTAQPAIASAGPQPENLKQAASTGLPTASKETPFVNTLGMKFVPVPGTQVLFSIWDTRVQDYAAYARVNNPDGLWSKAEKDGTPVSRDPDDPVAAVSWEDAEAFCQWLTEREVRDGKLPRTIKYRLPTDDEWSRAVGLPPEKGDTPAEKSDKNQTEFPWGTDFPPEKKMGNYADATWHEAFPKEQWIEGYTDGYATTSPVGSFPANIYGLYDMGGNVWQWCEDWCDKKQIDRVLRGAAWNVGPRKKLLSSHRFRYFPGARFNDMGFRCVLSPATITLPKPAPSLAETVASGAGLVKTYRNSLVFVTGANGSGSGFLANYGNGSVLFTNAHVAAGVKGAVFKTLDGAEVKLGTASCAVGHDVFLLQATALGPPLEIMKGVDENAVIGDDIVVLGNAEGAGVINTITGKIVGLGPQLVEVDAPFQPGNSGSPIIHLKSGKVIGVATYAIIRKYDPATKEPVKEPVIRRFGYRLDSIKSWQPVNWSTFSAQAAEMEAIEKLTTDLAALLDDLARNSRVTRGVHNNPVIKNRIDSWLEDRAKRLSARDAAMADESFLSFLKVTCENDVTAARQHMTYDYFQRDLADQQRERDEIAGAFDQIIQNIRQK